jgi:radical SAM family uncharacterized protein
MERILPRVQKPARYTGGEYNAVVKDRDTVDIRMALCFPDVYEIGMSNLGVRILYGLMNGMDGVWCERAFAPWGDMEEQMRREGIALYGLESGDPIADFDLIGFSLGYELSYTNLLNMLDLAGLPLRSCERDALAPLVIAGGTCAFNPEPLAPFVDLFALGEGEEILPELVALCRRARDEEWEKSELLSAAARIPGIYVPSLYGVTYREDGTVAAVTARGEAPGTVTKRIIKDLDNSYFPVHTIVPSTEIVHDRVMLELFRGCIRGCRFCQAGFIYRPVRSKNPELLKEQGIAACRASGYQEMTLASFPPAITAAQRAVRRTSGVVRAQLVSLSLPSLRADNFSMELMKRLQHVRKSGFTIAPEAGTQRLQDAINKNVTEEDLLRSCRTAFSGGWNTVKLYFMLGLPTETDEDVLGIADLAQKVYRVWREVSPNRSRGVRITVSTACFVPKPHTPFQWEAQVTGEEYMRRVKLLRENMRIKSISYSWHDPETSFLEAVFSRGDRRLADVLERAWRNGAKFDAWSEYFSLQRWLDAFAACDLDPAFYANRERSRDEVFPWSALSDGVDTEFLWRERERCFETLTTPDCRSRCAGCGARALCPGGVCDA